MFSRTLAIVLCLALVSCKGLVEKYKRSDSGVAATEKKVLYDFRNTTISAPPAIAPDTEKQVLSASPRASCPVAANQPARAPHIAASVNGSFTYAAENETAYLVGGVPCGSGNILLVFSSGKLQVQSATPFSAILKTFDLNHDDQNEILMSVASTKNAVTDREASLVDFEKNVLHMVEDFGTVYHDPCGLFAGADEAKKKALLAGGRSPYLEAVVIWYLPRPEHQMPSFTAERYRAPCSDPTEWQPVGLK